MMANEEHVRILRQGAAAWNDWRSRNRSVTPDLSGADLEGIVMYLRRESANLKAVNLQQSNLRNADLRGADFERANLDRTRFDDANLWSAKFNEARAPGAVFQGAVLSGAEFFSANLVSTDMADATMDGVLCAAANLSGAILERAVLQFANFDGANLGLAKLMSADLSDAKIRNATLVWADLQYSNLSRVDIQNADLREATFGWTILCDVDLSLVRDLHKVIHTGPSHIGIDTVYRSGGNIPEAFLRGCGVPDRSIHHIRSLITQPTEFYSCFISYSGQDEGFVNELYNRLQTSGVRCWSWNKDMRIGDRIRKRIDESIHNHQKLLLVLSEHSVASDRVEQEVETALESERRQGRTIVLPICLDNAVMKIENGWPALVRNTRYIGDFRRWKDHNAYQTAFERLLMDLKAEEG